MAGGAVGAVIGGAAYGASAYEANRQENLHGLLDYNNNVMSGIAGSAGTARMTYQAARSGDMHTMLALVAAFSDKENVKATTDLESRKHLAYREAGIEGVAPGRLASGAKSWIGKQLASGFGGTATGNYDIDPDSVDPMMGPTFAATAAHSAEVYSTNELKKRDIDAKLTAQADAANLERVNADLATQGRFEDVTQYSVSSWQRNLGLRRMGRTGPGRKKDGTREDPAEWMLRHEASLERRGYTAEDEFGARRAIMGSMGSGYLNKVSALGLVGMQEGGASGMEGIGRAAGILGGMRAGAGLGGLQSMIGVGGLDPLVGSDLAGSLYQRSLALQSQFGTGPQAGAFVGAAAGLVRGGGVDTAQQQAASMTLGRGLGSWNAMSQGHTAPLYEAYSVLNSMRASGGFNAFSENMRSTDVSVLAGIARSGKMTADLGALLEPGQNGVGMVKDFLAGGRGAAFFESGGGLAPSAKSPAGKLLARIKDRGGDFVSLLSDDVRNLKGPAKGAYIKSFNDTLSRVALGGADNLFAQELQDPSLAPFLSGKGVHGTGPSGTEAAAAGAGAEQKLKDAAEFGAGGTKRIIDAIKSLDAKGASGEAMLRTLRQLQASGLANLPSAKEMAVFREGIIEIGNLMQNIASGHYTRIP